MKLTLTALTIAASPIASVASTFNPADLQNLKETKKCFGCDLSGANLEGANLENATLSFTLMEQASLCNTTMPDGSVIYSGF